MEIMEIKLFRKDNIYLIDIAGEMDLYHSNQLKELVMKMIEKKIEYFIIDLKHLETINSSGIGALIYISSTIKKMNLNLAIINVNKEVKKVMETTKLTGYFPIDPGLKEAVDKMTKPD
jgi:anti-sigma B factor antagonist